ncbi:MAG TPA: fibronectin type III domain-containing protein [Mycobacteriales bacterium]|nr:fibronectin type III domain-containing protein [Mycobacteriales bacterium]HVX70657.1 fibronectin type III domain-containing protein [Mycobacteriales bacterium]
MPLGGGTPVTLLTAATDLYGCYTISMAGSLVTEEGYNNSTDQNVVYFEHADGTGFGSVAIPHGYQAIAASADGEYVWSQNPNDTVEIGDLTTDGNVVDLATLPHSSAQFAWGVTDASGLLVTYADASCDDETADLAFVPAAGGTPTVLHQAATCDDVEADALGLGGGNAVWDLYDNSSFEVVGLDYGPTSGGVVHSATTSDFSATAITSNYLGYVSSGKLTTVNLSTEDVTTSSFDAADLASDGSKFVFSATGGADQAGIYKTDTAGDAPTKVLTDPDLPLSATAVALGPGRVAYSDNATPAAPIYSRSLTTSGSTLNAGPETLVTSSSTGYGISLSGVRTAYPDDTVDSGNARNHALELTAVGGSPQTISSSKTTPKFDNVVEGSSQLSGRRVLYPVFADDGRGYELYDDITKTSSPVSGSTALASVPSHALWGNFLVSLDSSGLITREDLSTGVTTPIHQIPVPAGDNFGGSVSTWGDIIAWRGCTFPSGGGACTESNGYLTAPAGGSPGAVVELPDDADRITVSNGYVVYANLAGLSATGTLVAQRVTGGLPLTITASPCAGSEFMDPYSIDGSTVAWLDCTGRTGYFSSGTPEAAPLPHVSNPPWFLGDPQAPARYSTGDGTWDADFVTSAVLTSCSIVISQGSTTVKSLPCDAASAALGEATASWDGSNAAGDTVAPGLYDWTLNASNADGALRNYDGTASPVMGTVMVDTPGVPDIPTGVYGTNGDTKATVSWKAPADHGTSAITGYDVQYSSDNGAHWTSASSTFHTSTATTQTVTGLTNGTYIFRIGAINGAGTGPYSVASTPVTIGGTTSAPGAPTGVHATRGNAQSTVSWTAPADNGGAAIEGYDVQYSSDNGAHWTSASSTFHTSTATTQTVTGLTNGTSYVFRVAAINSAGTGMYSPASAAVTPATVPGTPSGVSATAGDTSATVAWTAPASNGGSPVTGYDVQYSPNNGGIWVAASNAFHTSAATTQSVVGLTNGTSYVFRVAAINSVGSGAYSASSTPVTPEAPSTSPTPTPTPTPTGTAPSPLPTPTPTPTPTTTAGPATLTAAAQRAVTAGHGITVATTLNSASGPIAGVPIQLLGRLGSSGEWTPLRTLVTDSQGHVSTAILPIINCQIEWFFAGDATHHAATSPPQTINVRPVISTHRTKKHVRSGHVVTIYGTVAPHANGEYAVLQQLRSGHWTAIRQAKIERRTMPNGSSAVGYVIKLTPTKRGTRTLRIHVGATTYTVGASTHRFKLKVT